LTLRVIRDRVEPGSRFGHVCYALKAEAKSTLSASAAGMSLMSASVAHRASLQNPGAFFYFSD